MAKEYFTKKFFFELITNYQFSNLTGKNWKELILSQIILKRFIRKTTCNYVQVIRSAGI